ncbi:hypothetical protein M9458_008844, partial [Cirrhinus mrigala]
MADLGAVVDLGHGTMADRGAVEARAEAMTTSVEPIVQRTTTADQAGLEQSAQR